jgi:rhodanese-related sulfurtransferase
VPTPISRDELHRRITAGDITVVEALPQGYYDQAHLPGALRINHDEVDALAPDLLPDTDAPVATYCASATCPNSGIAARRLERLGYANVFVYEAGKADWLEAGLPVEEGATA